MRVTIDLVNYSLVALLAGDFEAYCCITKFFCVQHELLADNTTLHVVLVKNNIVLVQN